MSDGWTNDELETMIRSKNHYEDVNGEWFSSVASQICGLDDARAIEVARISLLNLAYRHAGFNPFDFKGSQEGLEHSMLRVIKMFMLSVKASDGGS